MAAHNGGFPDFFDDEWMNEQVVVDEWMDEQVEDISIAFCNENGIEVVLEQPLSDKTRDGNSKKPKPKKEKVQQLSELQLPVFKEMESLIEETYCNMEADDMIYHMYHCDIQKLKALDSSSVHKLIECRFLETCKGLAAIPVISPKAKEIMWIKFHEIWKDETFTGCVQKSLGITKDLCSWFLFTLQQTIAKRLLADQKSDVDIVPELNVDEKHTVTYICGSILKKLSARFYDLKRKTKAEVHLFLQKQIEIINECKEVADYACMNTNNKLIRTLSRGGLMYPKKQFVQIFFKVERIFRSCVSKTSSVINNEEIMAKLFEESSLTDQFFIMTESVASTDDHKFKLLKSCIALYLKIRSFGHAKNTIECYYSATKTEKKQKALRNDIKKKSDLKTTTKGNI